MKRLLLLITAVVSACSPEIRTYSDYNRDYNVSRFQTYGWSKPQLTDRPEYRLFYNELNEKRITGAVDDLLRVRGYARTDSTSELILQYHISVEERSVFLPDPYGYMYGDYFMGPRQDAFKYREATLMLDVRKSDNRILIWRGWAVGVLEIIIDESRGVDVAIKSAVAKILKDFPASTKGQQPEMTVR